MKPPGPRLSVVPEPGDADPELERHLGAARELAEPDASSRARVARALNAALPPSAPLPAFGANAASPASSPATLASAARLHAPWLAVGAIVIGGLGFGLGWTLGRSEPTPPSVTQSALSPSLSPSPQATLPSAPAPAATSPSSAGVTVSSPLALADDEAGARSPAPEAGPAVAPGAAMVVRAASSPARPATQSPRRSAPGARAGAPESSPGALDFRQALERLRRARTQLEQGHATASLLLLSELDRDGGELLLEEREATRVLALCATGETLAARASAERLAQRSPRSIYLRRLAASCIDDADRDAPSAESPF